MHAPAASLAEAKALRLQLADQQRQRSAAELRELVRLHSLCTCLDLSSRAVTRVS